MEVIDPMSCRILGQRERRIDVISRNRAMVVRAVEVQELRQASLSYHRVGKLLTGAALCRCIRSQVFDEIVLHREID